VQEGAINHLVVEGPQQMKKPLQSLIPVTPTHLVPTLVQHKHVADPAEHEGDPHAFLVAASYCSDLLHIPEGTDGVNTVQEQEQQIQQHGQAQNVHLHPKIFCSLHASEAGVEEQQVVVVYPTVVSTVGPITLAFPGYALLLRFAGRNGGMVKILIKYFLVSLSHL
jgi:hypothetical protein